jgi:hypothetical protein
MSEPMSPNNRKTWISVLIAAVIVAGILAVAAVGGTAFFIYRHVNTQITPEANAEEQFAQARARFAGQEPLIEMRRGDQPILHRDITRATGAGGRLESLKVLAYDPRARKLVNVSIPFWLIRMAPSNKFSFLNDNGIDFDAERLRLTFDDLERVGPGLLLDQKDRRGSQVLIWTE